MAVESLGMALLPDEVRDLGQETSPYDDPVFRRLLVGLTVSSLGDSALFVTLPIWAKVLTGSNAAEGLVFSRLGC